MNLKAASGATIDFDVAKKTGTLLVSGKKTAFALENATGVAGIYRSSGASKGEQIVGGWVVTNAGCTSGQVSRNGVSLEAGIGDVSKKILATDPVLVAPPVSIPADAQVMSLRCGIVNFRIGFNRSQESDATSPAAANDARDDISRLIDMRRAAGC